MSSTFFPKARTENLVIQTLPGETLVYDLTSHEAHCLNETAAFVWSQCSGDISIDGIVGSAESRFGQTVGVDLVNFAIAQLNDRKLLSENTLNIPPMQSRREAIRKIGLASAVALPIIASVTAPLNALAATSCGCATRFSCGDMPQCPSTTNCNANGICAP
jgi:hypothetical protein